MSEQEQYLLSIILVSYNHEKYVLQALDSVFSQDIKCKVEVIVADDCSQDNTLDIIKSFENSDSRFDFIFLESESNLGITRNYERAFAACNGKYIAVLECDDYWANSTKLSQQIDFLEEHTAANLCATNYYVFEEQKAQFSKRVDWDCPYTFIGSRELILDNVIGNFSTCMYRNSAIKRLPKKLFSLKSYDWIINISLGIDGLLGFISKPMSVYRLHSDGVWSGTGEIKRNIELLGLIKDYNEITNNVFEEDFANLSRLLQSRNHQLNLLGHRSIGSTVKRAIAFLHTWSPRFVVILIHLLLPNAVLSRLGRLKK